MSPRTPRTPPYSKDGRHSERLSAENQPLFARRLSPSETATSLELLDLFVRTIDREYVLGYGTLLGARLYRGFIPWDDDMDVLCRMRDYDRVRQSCKSGGLEWHDSAFPQDGASVIGWSKVWSPRLSTQGYAHLPWRWPFIDIYWLQDMEEDPEAYLVNMGWGDTFRYAKSDLFPAATALFEGTQYRCPRHPERVLQRNYPACFEYAMPSLYDHRREAHVPGARRIQVRLNELESLYPILRQTVPPRKKPAPTTCRSRSS